MTKVLFVGGMFFENSREDIAGNTIDAMQNAANSLQWNYVKGLAENMRGGSVDIINSYFIGWFPKHYKKPIIRKEKIVDSRTTGSITEVGFINFPIINTILKKYSIAHELKRWIKANNRYTMLIISYGFFEESICALAYAKNISDNVKTVLIIPDLPEFMSQNQKFIKFKRFLSRRAYFYFNKRKEKIDAYAVITKQMALKLGISNYAVIEGMVDDKVQFKAIKDADRSDLPFVFMYSGGLYVSVGVGKLIEVFEKIDCNCELWLFGDGELVDCIKHASQENPSIRYYGVLPQSEVLKFQHRADCLVNPRIDDEFTKYSFPSKNMEYLLSGTPVIAKALDGMPSEYKKYMFCFEDYEDLYHKMVGVMKMDKITLENKAKLAREFVINSKNCSVQTQKLLNMIDLSKS